MLISYAQNFEDVILWRALKHVERGFYIDIGAQDPVIDSVSLAFYERGWRGVHVEPTHAYAAKLRSARADEDVIEAAIARSPGVITLFEIAETGLSTGKQEFAQMHADSGFAAKSIEVEALPLSDLFARYPDREIHWLKIDVEGMENEVIASWQPALTRPWIVVIESTVPRSQEPDYSGWEPDLFALGYEFAYFDGLNRFYVHRDHKELRPAFSSGPNFFDDFALSGLASSPFALKLNSDIAGLKNELKAMSDQGRVDLAEIGRLHQHIADTGEATVAPQIALKDARLLAAEEKVTFQQQIIALQQQANELHSKLADRFAHESELAQALHDASAQHMVELGDLRNCLEDAKAQEVEHLSELQQQREAELATLRQRLSDLQGYIDALRASTSWRVTGPLRFWSRSGRWFARGSIAWLMLKPGARPRRIARRTALACVSFILARPRLKRTARRMTEYVPSMERRIRAMMPSNPARAAAVGPPVQPDVQPPLLPGKPLLETAATTLPPRARNIYVQLKAALADRNRGN